jgi:uncharacterized protein YdcH (DUF465 family)
MQVTLKKAHSLQLELENINNELIVYNWVYLNEFHKVDTIIETSQVALKEKVERKINLYFARYCIRGLIDSANQEYGISQMLNRMAYINKKISVYESIIKNIPENEDDIDVVKSKLNKISKSETSNQYGKETVKVTLITNDDNYQNELFLLKRQKMELKDDIASTNLINKITLPKDVVTILKKENLVF